MAQTFDVIKEKLKRSKENILNLQTEVKRFFEESKYPTLPQNNPKLLTEAIKYHSQRQIPLRFSVLAGEIAHHLRSCLDHIAWQFSAEAYRRTHRTRIEFPIFEARPVDKDTTKRYEGKIKGITNPDILKLVDALQPYNSPNPVESLLLVIHNMDITDKHRELVLCISTPAFEVPTDVMMQIIAKYPVAHQNGVIDAALDAELERAVKHHAKIAPTISFANFAGRELEPIVPAMIELNNEILSVVSQFDRYLPR